MINPGGGAAFARGIKNLATFFHSAVATKRDLRQAAPGNYAAQRFFAGASVRKDH